MGVDEGSGRGSCPDSCTIRTDSKFYRQLKYETQEKSNVRRKRKMICRQLKQFYILESVYVFNILYYIF